jgi:membrane fusion protein, multidrug efflux system
LKEDFEEGETMADLAPAPQKRETAIRRKPTTRRRLWTRAALLFVILGAVAGGYRLWRYFGTYESTDDAQVDGHILAVSARISGHVTDVNVEEERYVRAGDVLVRIDPTDYDAALAQASADLANAEAALESSRTDVPITSTQTGSQLKSARSTRTDAEAALSGAERQLNAARARLLTAQAQVRESEADYKRATDDVARYKKLIDKDEIPAQQYTTAVDQADAAKATVDARQAAVDEAQQNITVAQAAVEQANARIAETDASIESALTAPQQVAVSEARAKAAQAVVEQKRAALRQAQLNLSYCVIRAPFSGIIGKKTVEVGNNISPGQQLMALVPLDDIWVTANFKETQLRGMKSGDKVKFSVDAYGREYTGKLEAVGGASGSRFSLLPPENATGNYVKVVQRIPVRIDIDPGQNDDHRLRPGMSVVPNVYVE